VSTSPDLPGEPRALALADRHEAADLKTRVSCTWPQSSGWGALALGLICTSSCCYGAFEFAYKLEGVVTYVVLAAPVIAATAALIPPIAEATWRSGHALKALLWWAVLLPAGAAAFFSAAERVHTAKAGAEAERSALRVPRRGPRRR
jgi:hypothetical protein